MGRLTDLVRLRGRRDRGSEELSDEAMVRMLRAAAEELAVLRALVQRIAIITPDLEGDPGDAERKLRAIASMLEEHGTWGRAAVPGRADGRSLPPTAGGS